LYLYQEFITTVLRNFSKRQRRVLKHWWSRTYLESLLGGGVYKSKFSDLSSFVIFVGYPRSGHSLVGSLLDAHPEVVISNQVDILQFVSHNYSREQIQYLIWKNTRREAAAGRSNSKYNYRVPGQFQGEATSISVIGDKRGGGTSRRIGNQGDFKLLQQLKSTMGLRLKVVHVVRNPFDNLSTMVRRGVKAKPDVTVAEVYADKLKNYQTKLAVNQRLIESDEYALKTIRHENLVENPTLVLSEICTFLGVDAPADYLEACTSIIWERPNASRTNSPLWNAQRKEAIRELIQKYDFLKGYDF
jgi:hypothetical protein